MFSKARVRLTLWYVTSLVAISIFFSAIIYHVLSLELERFGRIQKFRLERRLWESTGSAVRRPLLPPPPPIDTELLTETQQRILLMLVFVNLGIAVAAGALGYVLSGKTLRPIKVMVEQQDRFISDASHELRTPLSSLLTSLEVYERNPKKTVQEAQSLVREAIEDVGRLQSLTQSLLSLARYEHGNHAVHTEINSIKNVIAVSVKKIAHAARQRHIHIDVRGTEASLQGDAHALEELFIILLDNAIKFSKESTAIVIDIHKKDPYIIISVADQGIGMSEAERTHIFYRFYQADSSRSATTSGGYGLGLSIAKQIVTQHGGSIHVTSTPHKGSTFFVTLPIGVKK